MTFAQPGAVLVGRQVLVGDGEAHGLADGFQIEGDVRVAAGTSASAGLAPLQVVF
jgi:hypothetical protein